MVDPAGVVAANLWIDHIAVFQSEVESVRIVGVVGGAFPRDAFAGVFDDACALANELYRVNASTMHAFALFAKGTDISERRIQREPFGCGFLSNVRVEHMKQSIALVLAFCIIAISASANLGDYSERIEDAYGTIVQRRLRDD